MISIQGLIDQFGERNADIFIARYQQHKAGLRLMCRTSDQPYQEHVIGLMRGTFEPPVHVKSLLEQNDIGPESVAHQLSEAVRRWKLPRDHEDSISEERMFAVFGAKKLIKF